VALLLPVGLHQAMLSLSGWGGDAGGLGFIDGQSARDHALGVRPSPLENGRRYTLRVKVTLAGEQASIDSFLDDKPFTHFRGQQASLSLEHKWGLRETGRPAIAAWASTVTFHRVRVRGGSGAGCVLDGKRSRREPYVQTPEVLGGGGMRFHDLAPEGSRLIGLRVAATSALNSLQPIYRGAAETLGTLHGAAKDDPVELRAKTGYAVGAVVTKTGGSIDGMRVVFFRDKGDRLDPSDRYESDWLGGRGGDQEMTYGGNGQPVVGVYGTADTDFHALGLMLVRGRDQDPAAPSAGMVSLTRLKPLRTTVGGWAFAVMRPEDRLWSFSESQPYVPEHLEYCKEFLFAHAPSRVVYALPPEAKSFSAVGYCAVSADVKFRVLFDGQVKYESPRAGVVPISVDVPPGAKTLEMVVDDLGNNSYDWSHWLEPRLYPCSAAQIGGSKAGNPVKLTERQPLSVSVGYYVLYVNQAPSPTPPPHFDRVEPCNELLFAHSPSHLTYAIPPGAREFTAIGHNVRSTTVKFRVFVDGQGAYESPLAGIVPIRVPLADGAKRLDLIVDDFDGNSMDHSFWCYPRFQGQMSLAK
jgi:hypothetical protein